MPHAAWKSARERPCCYGSPWFLRFLGGAAGSVHSGISWIWSAQTNLPKCHRGEKRFQRLHTVADNAAPPKTGGSFPDGPGWERTGRKEHCFLHKSQERHFLLRRKAESARYPLENFSDRFLLQRNRYRHIVPFRERTEVPDTFWIPGENYQADPMLP